MAEYTPNVNLYKPSRNDDTIDVDASLSENFQKIDDEFGSVTTNLAQKATKEEIQNIGNASPKGVYTTLSALQTAFPSGTTGIYVVSGDGKWYYWNGTAWTAGGTYQSTGIANKSIKPKQTTIFNFSKNFFNPNDPDVVRGGFYHVGTTWIVDAGKGQTGYIEAELGETFTVNGPKYNVYWFRDDKTYLTNVSATDFSTAGYVTAPANAKYVRFIFVLNDESTFQVEKNTAPTTYEPYWVKFVDGLDLSETQKAEVTEVASQTLNTKPFTGKKYMYVGDSITTIPEDVRGWQKYFHPIVQQASYINVASSGATWRDKSTTVYDGDPKVTVSANNVIGNQVQKIINNGYEAPDIIIMAAGTNDEPETVTDASIEQQFYVNGSNVPLENVDRKTFAGAIRWSVEKLRELYPNAQIFLTTPLQRASHPSWNNYTRIKDKGDIIKKLGLRMSVPVIDTMECGIYGQNAIDGQATLDHNDGLHLSAIGAEKMGKYVARKIIDWYSF